MIKKNYTIIWEDGVEVECSREFLEKLYKNIDKELHGGGSEEESGGNPGDPEEDLYERLKEALKRSNPTIDPYQPWENPYPYKPMPIWCGMDPNMKIGGGEYSQ